MHKSLYWKTSAHSRKALFETAFHHFAPRRSFPARARRAYCGGGGGCGFRPGSTARRGLSGVLRLEDARLPVLRAGRRERAAAHGRLRPGGPSRHRAMSKPPPPRAGPRAHNGRALMRGNQRHGPHHDAAAVRRHAHRRERMHALWHRVSCCKNGGEPLRHDRALRQPAEPVSVLLLWAAPRRFPYTRWRCPSLSTAGVIMGTWWLCGRPDNSGARTATINGNPKGHRSR